jgi:DNA polymerase III delta prime subunit
MKWEQIIGQQSIKNLLRDSIQDSRVGHAQLFVGEEGFGVLPLALAMAREIFEKENPASVHKVENLNHLDLHFSFPVFSEKNVSLSKRFSTISEKWFWKILILLLMTGQVFWNLRTSNSSFLLTKRKISDKDSI